MDKGNYEKTPARCYLLRFSLLYPGPTKEILVVMVNFTYQLKWATVCPNIWSYIIPGVPARVFLKLTFELVG